jgi:transcriptional regulator with XRE-family HTH domain
VFYDKFVSLCKEKGVAPTRAALDIGLSKSAPIKWRTTGATPNGETLNKIAEYFSVSVSVLFGEETKKAPTPKGEREMDDLTNEILNELEGMSHAEILLVKERIQKIKESRE